MVAVAKSDRDVVLPVTEEWRHRVTAELAQRGRGAHAALAKAIGCPTGHLTELLADEKPDEKVVSRYSRYVEPINNYFKWPSMMPLSQDTAEIQHLLEGLPVDAKSLLTALKDLPPEEAKAMITLIMLRRGNPET